MSECVREPDPVPDSRTTEPGLSSNAWHTNEMSGR